MNNGRSLILNETVYYRLTALWVICEAFAGGIMHGLKIPFTGMMVSSLAVMCIILIAWHNPSHTAIIKATIIVAIFKLMLSPHSPPTAYIAVFFQGLLGQLLFSQRKYFTASAILLAAISLAESAIQRILVLVILYGNEFWTAVNKYLQKLTGEKETSNYSLWIAGGYILIHLLVGIAVGYYAARLAKKTSLWSNNFDAFIFIKNDHAEKLAPKTTKRKKLKGLFFVAWLLLVVMFIQSYINPSQAVLPRQDVFKIFLRSLLIILSWYLLVSPLLMRYLKNVLTKQQSSRQQHANDVMSLLPQTKYIFIKSWELSANEKSGRRLKLFLKILLM
ncbi:MAG TPA: hypothetical protein VLR49_00930, partial [Ferruginibacter sp.]|nr:hypothetical protein [Ferruginibacter sp.]